MNEKLNIYRFYILANMELPGFFEDHSSKTLEQAKEELKIKYGTNSIIYFHGYVGWEKTNDEYDLRNKDIDHANYNVLYRQKTTFDNLIELDDDNKLLNNVKKNNND